MRRLAWPSPYGLWTRRRLSYSSRSSSSRSASVTIRATDVPTSFTVPASTASGRSVFSRDARSVTLTTDGEMLLGYARRMLAINREAVSKFIIPDISGVVRIGSPDDYGERVLPHVLKRFAQSHPSIAVDVIIDQSANLRRRMDDRELDITLVTKSSRNPMAGAETLLTEPIVWARWIRRSRA